MRAIAIGRDGLTVPELALGCMRIDRLSAQALDGLIETAMGLGINFFEHADIYADGRCEELFAAAAQRLRLPRESMLLQSKCGIHDGQFDFSKAHILGSVDGILRRLRTDYLDALVLHRPDVLVEPEEVGEAFTLLAATGKVRAFGVSNHRASQIALLQSGLAQQLVFNQLQFGLAHTPMIDAGLHVNMVDAASVAHDDGVFDYCRLMGITVQAWSPFQHGFFEGPFFDSPRYADLNAMVHSIASGYGVSDTAVAVAWISRHPARVQTLLGTTSAQRLRDAAQSQGFSLTREQWYALYRAAGNTLP